VFHSIAENETVKKMLLRKPDTMPMQKPHLSESPLSKIF
jgi:hypothetical protein